MRNEMSCQVPYVNPTMSEIQREAKKICYIWVTFLIHEPVLTMNKHKYYVKFVKIQKWKCI